MFKQRIGLFNFINRVVYMTAAGLLISALMLGMVHHTVQACADSGQLQLSDITCLAPIQKVQVQFILNQVKGSNPGNTVYFKLKVNNGPAIWQTAPFTRKTGEAYHYIYYGTKTGYYDVTDAYVYVGSTKIYLHNPDKYSNQNNKCFVVPTPTTPVPTTAVPTTPAPTTPVPTTETVIPTTETPVPTTETPVPTTETAVPTTETPVPTTETPVPTTETAVPTTETAVPTTETPVPTTETPVPTTETVVPTTETVVPTTETVVPTTETVVPTTETPVPTTETPVPTTETAVPTTETPVPTTETPVPTTETPVPTTETAVPTTETAVPTTETVVPTTETVVPTSDTPGPTREPKKPQPTQVPEAVSITLDPYCTTTGLMQWTVENPNSVSFKINYWTLDGGAKQPGFTAPPGSTKFATTSLGTHTITLYYGESQSVSLTDTLDVCPLPIPNTGSGLLIPVTGTDQTKDIDEGLFYGGLAFAGLGLILSALRKFLSL